MSRELIDSEKVLRARIDAYASSDVTFGDIERLQVSVLYSQGSLPKDARLDISRTLGVLREILKDARS